ncbi:MAG: 50S ribosomal protein L5 [Phycisphaeraceae bacterium]|nr:MAG: 50S ribosomal protein L5 [Phycisphaeraceae bacterium]
MAKDKDKNKDGQDGGAVAAPAGPPRLRVRFEEEVLPKTASQYGRQNPMSRPQIEKIVLNVNMGRHLEGNKIPANVRDAVLDTLTVVSGQRPVIAKAKKSVSNFKVREGAETAAYVTLRRERMWHFLDRLVNLVTPRIKDFRGLPEKSFDPAGNYSMGLSEQAVFPEIDMANASFTHGMHINIVFSNSNPEISRFVLEELGMPFRKPEVN